MFYQQLINGLMLGASYSLVAIGYTLIFGVLNLLYFAHGEIFMVGAFVGLYLVIYAGANIYFALLGAMIACGAMGALAYFVAVRPVAKDRPLAPLISTIGLTIILQNLAIYIFGGQQLAFPEAIEQKLFHFGPITISSVQLFILGVALASMIALWLFIERTKLGRAMRATAENPRVAGLMGVDSNKVIVATFAIGAALAAVAGVMWGANYASIKFSMGALPGLKAFCAAVLGGIGNIYGAMLGGILLGLIESLGAGYIAYATGGFLGSNYQDIFAFIVLIIVLTLRPSGIMGERVADRA